ncbi:MAG: diguanylate cyclase [Magnetococcales bacterium]|nr:diguanylate cyclase [Magnetococcales bacterium]
MYHHGGIAFTRQEQIYRVQSINQPCIIDNIPAHVGASIGISLYPEHGIDTETLLRKADLPLYAVKQCGRNHCLIYQPEFEDILH